MGGVFGGRVEGGMSVWACGWLVGFSCRCLLLRGRLRDVCSFEYG